MNTDFMIREVNGGHSNSPWKEVIFYLHYNEKLYFTFKLFF